MKTDLLASRQKHSGDVNYSLRGFMSTPAQVQAITGMSETLRGADCVFRTGGVSGAIDYCREQTSPEILVIDISDSPEPLLALDQLANFCEPHTRVIICGQQNDVALYQSIMQFGVTEYLPQPLLADAYHRAVHVALGVSQRDYSQAGKQVAVFGMRGGVGSSTLAANLAWHLSQRLRVNTALVDLDLRDGDLDLLLGFEASDHLARLLGDAGQVQDQQLLDRAVEPLAERLQVLKSRGASGRINADVLATRLQQLSERAGRVILDLPRGEPQLCEAVLEQTDIRILVVDPSLSALRQLTEWWRLHGKDLPGQRTLVVLNYNRSERHAMLKPQQFAEQIQRPVDHILPCQPDVVGDALDLGQPLVAGNSRLAQAIRVLADDVMGQGQSQLSWWQQLQVKINVRA